VENGLKNHSLPLESGFLALCCPLVAATRQGGRSFMKGLRRKLWTQTKILSPNIRYFVAILIFVAIYAPFGRLCSWAKKCFLGSKTAFLGHYYVVHIAYHAELNLQFCNYAQKGRVCCKNSKYAPDKKLCCLFLLSPNGCQLLPPKYRSIFTIRASQL